MGPAVWLVVVAVPLAATLLFSARRLAAPRGGPDPLESDVVEAHLAAARLGTRLRRLRVQRLAMTDAASRIDGAMSRRLVARPMVPALSLQALPVAAPVPVGRATLWRDTSLVLVALAVVGLVALALTARPDVPARGSVLAATGTPHAQPSPSPNPVPSMSPIPSSAPSARPGSSPVSGG